MAGAAPQPCPVGHRGRDPVAVLHDAASTPLGKAHDAAAVLDWRLPTSSPTGPEQLGPLRWLPATPDVLADHPQWGPYLHQRAQLVAELADQVRDAARAWDPSTSPMWARPLVDQRSALMAEIAVFRAAHDVDPADTRITGPEQHANRSAMVEHLIHARLDADLTRAGADTARWRQLADNIDTHIVNDPVWPRLATHLDDAARAGADVAALLDEAIAAHGPLPAEMPAAALWWRLAGTLAPPSLERADTKLRPPWTAELHHLLGTRIAEAVITDPAWPGLVAAVAASDWPPADLLAAAADHLHDIAATQTLRPTNTPACSPTASNCSPTTPPPSTPTSPTPPNRPRPPLPTDPTHTPATSTCLTICTSHHQTPTTTPTASSKTTSPASTSMICPASASPRPDSSTTSTSRPAGPPRRRPTPRPTTRRRQPESAGGPAEQAAGPELADLHRRLHEQRPYQHALARAHTLWVHAEDTAELHHQLLDQLSAAVTAANNRVDQQAATRYQQHRDQVTEQTQRINTAAHTARTRLDAARAELIDAAGGVDNIVTEHHIHTRRAAAVRTDTQALNDARRIARDLYDQLSRAEAVAARSFAQNPAHSYDLAADMPQLRAEIAFLEAAATTSPAALYHPPDTAVAGLDETHRRAVAAITSSPQTVQPLRIHPGAIARGAGCAGSHRPPPQQPYSCPAWHPGRRRLRRRQPLRRHHRQPRRRPHQTGHQPLETPAGQPDRRRRRRPPTARTAALAHPNRRGHRHQTGPYHHRR